MEIQAKKKKCKYDEMSFKVFNKVYLSSLVIKYSHCPLMF